MRLSHSSYVSQGRRTRQREARASPTNGLADNRPNTVTISILHGSPDLSCLRMNLILVMLCNRILFRGELASRSGSCRLRPYGTYHGSTRERRRLRRDSWCESVRTANGRPRASSVARVDLASRLHLRCYLYSSGWRRSCLQPLSVFSQTLADNQGAYWRRYVPCLLSSYRV